MRSPSMISFWLTILLFELASGEFFQQAFQSFADADVCSVDEPNDVLWNVRSELECAQRCSLQSTTVIYNFIPVEARCELYEYKGWNFKEKSGCKAKQKIDSQIPICPEPGSITKFPAQCCALPFTLNGGRFFGCTQDPADPTNVGCFLSPGVWVTCNDASKGYIATNKTANMTFPTFPQPIRVTSINNWIVIQQRVDQANSLSAGWANFKSGFRTYNGIIWLGLETVYQLTKSYQASLRIEMLTTTGNWFSAEYAGFFLDAETNHYAIHVTGYSGDSGDIMWNQNGMNFSTATNDNDLSPDNCAMNSRGGFWYNACFNFNLNGNSTSYYGWLNGVQYFFVSSRMMLKINP